ncbi:MAG: HupE/UreJ family protein [Gammaproteobacteria bacterium]|nr:HupE/UreJ family protein [Gammaproteobacteria bacterium]MBT8134228.1 HupE/UreJ family protein [Gammaproteobacteria bacterium]NNJ49075.1 HupE/UreJ family protein [Gammaproteobacteria bacterium]
MKKLLFILFLASVPLDYLLADVVKPALVEINIDKQRLVNIEVRASIEALLTGINAQYKNTQDAPNAEEYDDFRKLPSEELHLAFESFKQEFLESVFLRAADNKIELEIASVEIPPTGYTKVPRISVIKLSGKLPVNIDSVEWYYPAKFGDNAVRVRQIDTENQQWHWSQWQWLRNDEVSDTFSLTEIVASQSTFDVIVSYISIGFEHIVPKGLDHIFFILGLFLLSTHLRPLLWQVTMFTVAHTITLALSMNNIVELPANVVEPLIALSIAYVGVENILASRLHRSRLFLVFLFGLLHGLGFAGVLSDFGMPSDDFALALISFNIGVEFGQLAVILIAYISLRIWFKDQLIYRKIVVVPGSMFISVVGLYWFLERLELF